MKHDGLWLFLGIAYCLLGFFVIWAMVEGQKDKKNITDVPTYRGAQYYESEGYPKISVYSNTPVKLTVCPNSKDWETTDPGPLRDILRRVDLAQDFFNDAHGGNKYICPGFVDKDYVESGRYYVDMICDFLEWYESKENK